MARGLVLMLSQSPKATISTWFTDSERGAIQTAVGLSPERWAENSRKSMENWWENRRYLQGMKSFGSGYPGSDFWTLKNKFF